MNFDDWFKEKYPKTVLKPWQQKAIQEFLFIAYPYRKGPTGKTFCLKFLTEFINEHGNDYEL